MDIDRDSIILAAIASGKQYAEYANIPSVVASVISAGKATLHELQTIYGLEDLYDMLEIVIVDNYNNYEANRNPEVG